MKTHVLVTGASGMLGAHIAVRLVKDGHVVHIFLRSKKHPMLSGLPVVEHHGDLENEGDVDVALRNCQLVFHVAGTVSYRNADKNRLYRSNVLGTRNVINAAVRNKIKRLVHTSSTAAVGWSKDPGTVLDESAEPDQEMKRTPYSWTKYLSEKENTLSIPKIEKQMRFLDPCLLFQQKIIELRFQIPLSPK